MIQEQSVERKSPDLRSALWYKRFRVKPDYAIWVVIIFLVGIPAATNPAFRSLTNLQGIAQSSSVLIVLAMGQAVVLLMAGVDLSIGALADLGSVLIAMLLTAHWSLILSIVVMALVIGVLGFINGLGVARLRIPSFIVSFGMMGLAGAIGLEISQGTPIPLPATSNLSNLVYNSFGGIADDFWLALGLLVLLSLALHYLPFGRHLYAVGSNRQAARVSGVRVERTIIWGFIIAALMASLAGVVYASQVMSGDPTGGVNLNLESIAAAVIGGVSLFGGKGKIWGAFIGALVYSLITNVLNVYGVNPNLAELVSGVVIIGASYVSVLGQRGGARHGN